MLHEVDPAELRDAADDGEAASAAPDEAEEEDAKLAVADARRAASAQVGVGQKAVRARGGARDVEHAGYERVYATTKGTPRSSRIS